MIENEPAARGDAAINRATAASIAIPDPEHSLHVARLSLRLYDQLRDVLGLPASGRDLLAAAALWHDAGQLRNIADHHRHTYSIIMEQPIPGYTRFEQLQIAAIARYHRRAHPSREHPGYRDLPRRLRPTVDAMAALLRIAEGLDASHLQLVRDLEIEPHVGYVTVRLVTPVYPMLEGERAQERAGLFREVFHQDIEFVATIRGEGNPEGGAGGDRE
jgi:exopolyphosphatase/guanosine-5'-triphosphate,3'-diphosphate pyrophosphatase